ncbi:MAG: hypothetical protein ABSE45_10890 [Candidatus Acidiferrales bacterium]|jgi:hypothetical protein
MALQRGIVVVWQLTVSAILVVILVNSPAIAIAHDQTGGSTAAARPIGTIKTISGNAIVLASDAGPLFNVSVEEDAKILRIEPGAKDLKNASPMQLQDLQAGDRILVLGKVSDDGHSVVATSVIVMKKADVVSKQEHDRQEWQRRGVGGLVSVVDPMAGTITISTQSFAGARSVVIRISRDTIMRRYAADSVKFDDAKPSSLDEIRPGDQVRARGTRSSDGSELAADEVVSGAFRNIAGVVASVDPSTNTLSIMDLISKKPVTVKITPKSQLRKLPPQMAQFMATRLKGGGSGAGSGAAGQPAAGQSAGASSSSGATANGDSSGDGLGGRGGSRGGDLQQMLSKVPPASFADLQKGDAVMIVSTEGAGSGGVTAITLVAGVEPILQASPNGGQSMTLPPWSLDAPAGDAAQ